MRKQSRITRTDEHEGRDGYWKGEADDNRKRQAKNPRRKKLKKFSNPKMCPTNRKKMSNPEKA